MPCCSSCGLPVQGHQLPMGPRCAILSAGASHASGLESECTICLQPWSSHPKGKHINKECKFCQQQAPGDTASDELDTAKNCNVQARLMCITQENHAIKAQLSQLTELVWQLLPQQLHAAQTTLQPADASNPSPGLPPAKDQALGTSGAALSLPPPSWSQLREATPGESSGDHWAVHLSSTGQSTMPVSCASLPAVSASVAPLERPVPLPGLHTRPLWTPSLSPGMSYPVPSSSHQQLAPTASQLPAQVPATIWGRCSVGSILIFPNY